MDFAYIWIGFAILSLATTGIVYAWVIPTRISKLPEPEQEATCNRSRKRFYYVQLVWLTAVLATGIIISNIGLILFSIFGFCWTYLAFAIYFFYKSDEIDKMDARQRYKENVKDVVLLFVFAVITGVVALCINADNAAREAENAQYDQVATYHLNTDGNKLEGEPRTLPISNLRTSNNGYTYSWLERKTDGSLVPVSVNRENNDLFEVTLKDDLPATDTEARVERIVDYKVKGADVAAGKEICGVKDAYGYDRFFHALPACEDGKTAAKFIKSYTIIHIPAGSAEKILQATN